MDAVPMAVGGIFNMSGVTNFTLRFLVFALVHSLLASRNLHHFVKTHMRPAFRIYRLGYNLLALIMFGWVMGAPPMSPVIYYLPGFWSIAFYLLQLFLLIMLARCTAQTGMGNFLGLQQLREVPACKPVLVTSGCYARVRHPQYSLAVLLLLFTPVMTQKWLALTAMAGLYFAWGVFIEGRRLLEEFGDEYRRYRERVPMFVPRFRG